MPRARDTVGLKLSQCHELGLLIRVTCNFCTPRAMRFYRPDDLVKLLGDAEVDGLRRRLVCETCGKRDWTEVEGKWIEAVEKQHVVVRRLVGIRTIRRPVWRDERL